MGGDRHLRPDPDGRLGGSPPSLAVVLVKVSKSYAQSTAGQHLLQLLVNLLARQFGVVHDVLLEIDDCDLQENVILCPHIRSGTLVAGLLALGKAAGGELTTTRIADGTRPTVVVCVGDGLGPDHHRTPDNCSVRVSMAGHRIHHIRPWGGLSHIHKPFGTIPGCMYSRRVCL